MQTHPRRRGCYLSLKVNCGKFNVRAGIPRRSAIRTMLRFMRKLAAVRPRLLHAKCLGSGGQAQTCQSARGSGEALDVRPRRSCAAPGGSCLRSTPKRSNRSAPFYVLESAAAEAQQQAAARESRSDKLTCVFRAGAALVRAVSRLPCLGFVPLVPSNNDNVPDEDPAVSCSMPARRSPEADLPNQHQAGRLDRLAAEDRTLSACDWTSRPA